MGRAKEAMMRQEDLGYSSVGDKYVCSNCFGDYAISQFIKSTVESKACDYCETESSSLIASHMDKVLEFIAEGINREWSDPNYEGLGWDGREGGWQGDVIDGYDLVCEGHLDLEVDQSSLIDDIARAFQTQEWCESNYYALRPHLKLRFGWENFCKIVKHESRYVFFRLDDLPDEYDDETIPASGMLDVLAQLIDDQGLLSQLPLETSIYRARIHDTDRRFTTALELGSPPIESANYPNRMSPAGIPMFYGGSDEATAILEIYNQGKGKKKASCGQFKPLKKLNVLDLTQPIIIPSLFDEDKYQMRAPALFLQRFIKEISKDIDKDKKNHIEYVPTQVFAEYFRHIFRDKNKVKLDGIVYKSSKNPGGVNYVLFAGNEHCCDLGKELPTDEYQPKPWLVLQNVKILDPEKVTKNTKQSGFFS